VKILHDGFVVCPAVEALGEATRLLVLEGEEELSGTFGLLDTDVLDVDLEREIQ
jgi:hypothetical protein